MARVVWRTRLVVGILAFGFTTGCLFPGEPDAQSADLLIVGLTSGRLLLVNSREPSVVGSVGPRMRWVVGAAVANDAQVLFLNGQLPDQSWKLVAIDLRQRRVLWMLDLATPDSLIPHNGVKLFAGAEGSAPNADGTTLYVSHAQRGDTNGIAVLGTAERNVVGFFGGLLSRGVLWVPQSPLAGDLLVAIGTRSSDQRRIADSAYVIRTSPAFEVTEAIPPPLGSVAIGNLSKAPGLSINVVGPQSVGLYDLESSRYRKVVPRLEGWFGPGLSSPDGSTLVLLDHGLPPIRPTGLIPVLGANLEPLAVIDLRSVPTPGGPLAVSHAAFGRLAPELYVIAGTGKFRNDFAPQPAQLVIIDRRTWSVRATLDLQDWLNGAWIFTLP